MIPKIIHYCWFGGKKKPASALEYIKSWEKYCSDYKIIEWNESNFDISCNTYVKEAYQAKKWAFVTDYVRLFVLYNYGGVYMDTDIEVLKPLDSFLCYNAFLGFESAMYISTGIMGAVKYSMWIKLLLDDYKDRHFIRSDGSFDYTTNVKTITKLTKKHLNICLSNKFQILDGNTCTVHHFAGSWLKSIDVDIYDKCNEFSKKYKNIFIYGAGIIGREVARIINTIQRICCE